MLLTDITRHYLHKTAVHFVRLAVGTPGVLWMTRDWSPYWRGQVWILLLIYWGLWLALALTALYGVWSDPLRRQK